jgi:hypothetical protein
MRSKFAAAIVAATLSVSMAGGLVLATAAPAMAQTAPASKYSVETTLIGDLLANDATKAIVLKYMPTLMDSPYLEQVKQMTLRGVSAYPQAGLDDAKLKAMQAELDAVK